MFPQCDFDRLATSKMFIVNLNVHILTKWGTWFIQAVIFMGVIMAPHLLPSTLLSSNRAR